MGWADREGVDMTRWDQKRPVGWFSPWREWLGSTFIFWWLIVVMVIALACGWILRCRGQ